MFRIRLVKRLGIALLAARSVASCGARTDTTPVAVRLANLPALAAQAFCNNIGHCCTDAGRSFDHDSCVRATQSTFRSQFPPRSDATDAEIPGECVADVEASAARCQAWSPCAELLETGKHATATEPCSGTCFRGAGTLICEGSSPGQPDTSACLTSEGLYCSHITGTCAPRAAVGQPCTDPFGCETSRCDLASLTCAPYLQEGSDCTQALGGCAEGFVCEAGPTTFCTAGRPFAAGNCVCARVHPDGAECEDDLQCAYSRCTAGRCQELSLSPSQIQVCGG